MYFSSIRHYAGSPAQILEQHTLHASSLEVGTPEPLEAPSERVVLFSLHLPDPLLAGRTSEVVGLWLAHPPWPDSSSVSREMRRCKSFSCARAEGGGEDALPFNLLLQERLFPSLFEEDLASRNQPMALCPDGTLATREWPVGCFSIPVRCAPSLEVGSSTVQLGLTTELGQWVAADASIAVALTDSYALPRALGWAPSTGVFLPAGEVLQG